MNLDFEFEFGFQEEIWISLSCTYICEKLYIVLCGLLGSTLKGWLTIWELVMYPAARGKKGPENVLLKLSLLHTPLQSTG